MRPCRTNLTFKTTNIFWFTMRDSTNIWIPLSTTRCTGGKTQKSSWDKIKDSSVSNYDPHTSIVRILKKARKVVKKTSQDKEILFPFCKRAGVPQYNYYSNSDSSWNDVEYPKKNISVSVTDRDSVTKSSKKQDKHWKKELKRYQMKTEKFYKLVSQYLKKSDLKRNSKIMEDSSDSESNSDSDLDTIIKQEIRRCEHQEKPSFKKLAVDKDFRLKKPHIEPKTGDWIW